MTDHTIRMVTVILAHRTNTDLVRFDCLPFFPDEWAAAHEANKQNGEVFFPVYNNN